MFPRIRAIQLRFPAATTTSRFLRSTICTGRIFSVESAPTVISQCSKLLQLKRHLITSSTSSAIHAQPATSHLETYKSGDLVHNYRVEAVEAVSELNLTAYRLRHTKTGAEHLHIARDDPNNVFSVSFRTTPEDSTGVAHILEHLALCGSSKYPVRDPFMKMLNRSLSTFMNAFTGPDYTMYPFSTQNSKDFYNLLSIYLDAAFYPRLRYLDFLQEGWRLEHANVADRSSPLIFKGVVFNEMKGVFSSSSAIYSRSLLNKVFPENTYKNESGGDPLVIPSLTYEQLKSFHARHYHPSNSRFFTYGNMALESHLEAIDKFLEKFEENPKLWELSVVGNQSKWTEGKRVAITCQVDPLAAFPDRQTTAGIAYMLAPVNYTNETFTLAILSSLLMDGPSSPFYEALIDSGLGSDYSPFSGYSNYTKQTLFSIGLQGIKRDQVETVEKAIRMALKNAYTEGFPQERIDAILHRIELSTKHQSSNFGLNLAMSVNSPWNHGVDPILCLKVNEHVKTFKKNLQTDPKFLQKKVKEYFIDNPHQLLIEMSPDQKFEELMAEKEEKLLKDKVAKLNEAEKEEIFKTGQELLRVQDTVEDLSVLPTLSVRDDISRVYKKTSLEHLKVAGVPTQYTAQPTNGIVYFNAVLKLRPETFPKRLIPYLPLFTQVMTRLGAGKFDRKQQDQEIQMKTGGLGTGVHLADHPESFDRFEKGIHIASHCLEGNIDSMFSLWTDVFNQIRFEEDTDHLIQLIKICSAELAAGVPHQGHTYAMNRAASFFGGAFKLRELTSGISNLASFRILAAASGDKINEIIQNLKEVGDIALNTGSMRFAVNAEAPSIRNTLVALERFVEEVGGEAKMPAAGDQTPSSNVIMPQLESRINEHYVFPFSTNYIGKALYSAPFAHADYAKMRIATSLVSAKFLHKEIREKGGAYGGGARLDSGGVVHYFSYRDANVTQTIDAFNRVGEWLMRTDNYTAADIDEAKLKVFQAVDSPITPAQQGIEMFLNGITDDMRQQYRERLLDVTKAEIQEVTEKYLIDESQQSGVILLGPSCEVTGKSDKWKVRMFSN